MLYFETNIYGIAIL